MSGSWGRGGGTQNAFVSVLRSVIGVFTGEICRIVRAKCALLDLRMRAHDDDDDGGDCVDVQVSMLNDALVCARMPFVRSEVAALQSCLIIFANLL